MSVWPPDDIEILDLDDLDRPRGPVQRRPRQPRSTSRDPTESSTDPRYLVPLLLLLVAVFVIVLAITSDNRDESASPDPSSQAAEVEQSELAQRVQAAQVRAGFHSVQVTEESGVIIIAGTVADELEAAAVGAVARSVEGVENPHNRVIIAGGVGTPAVVADSEAIVVGAGGNLAEQLDNLGEVTFEAGSATLTAEGTLVMDSVAALLNQTAGVQVEVHGHTDADGDESDNQVLSQERADAVITALGQRGVDIARLTAVGFGESNPIAPNITEEGRALNRRIEFVPR